MPFLIEDDYSVQIRTEVKSIIAVSPASQLLAEQMAEEEMTGYLRPRGYDVPAIFTAAGALRNPLIIMYMIDIVLYHLYSNIATRAMPKTREDRYTAAISWLDKVRDGKLDPDLPRVADPEDATPNIKLGSNPKYAKRY